MTLTNTGTGTNNAALTSLTINQNTASTDSGGLYIAAAANGVVSIRNSILDGNTVTAQGYNGPIDVTLTNNLALNDIGYNLVGTSDTMFGPKNKDILNNTTGLASALAGNGAKAGYPQTLALTATKGNTSPGYETGDPGLAGQPDPLGKDERGLTRQAGKVSIGAEDPDAM